MKPHVLRWIIFGVIFAVIPLVFAWLDAALNSPNHTLPDLTLWVGQGQLLLVAVAINGSAFGEVVGRWHGRERASLIASGASIVVMLLASYVYAKAQSPLPNSWFLSLFSLVAFGLCLINSFACITISRANP